MDNEFEKIKLKFEAIWKARELEMESFSARALYIWGFLALCYGAYAFLLYQAVSTFLLQKQYDLSHQVGIFNPFNGLLMVVATGIFVLSILWVCLIKGANAWAEKTDWMAENYTHDFLRTNPVAVSCCAKQVLAGIQNRRNCKKCKGNPCHACLLGLFPHDAESGYIPKWDKSLISPHGGTYSPNKVYLFIAQISMWIGIVLTTCHAALFFFPLGKLVAVAKWLSRDSWIVGIAALILSVLLPCVLAIGNWLRRWLHYHLGSVALEDDMSVFRALQGKEES